METAKAAEDSAQAEERDRKVQKVRKGARRSYEQTVFEGLKVFFTLSQKFEDKFSLKEPLAADAEQEGSFCYTSRGGAQHVDA